jgi:GNAT superfamily N-acetyltransferase
MLPVNITIAGPQHAVILRELSVTTFVQTFAASNRPEDMEKYLDREMSLGKIECELQDPDSIFFLAWDGDTLAGFAKINSDVKADAPEEGLAIEIERLYTLQAYHGKKVGAQLMQHCLNYAKENGFTVIWLGVWEHNHKAIAFYQKWGYTPYGTHFFRLGNDDQTDVLMKKLL